MLGSVHSRVSLKFICLISDLTPVNDVVTSGLETMARILVTDLGDSFNTSDKLAISWKLGRYNTYYHLLYSYSKSSFRVL